MLHFCQLEGKKRCGNTTCFHTSRFGRGKAVITALNGALSQNVVWQMFPRDKQSCGLWFFVIKCKLHSREGERKKKEWGASRIPLGSSAHVKNLLFFFNLKWKRLIEEVWSPAAAAAGRGLWGGLVIRDFKMIRGRKFPLQRRLCVFLWLKNFSTTAGF